MALKNQSFIRRFGKVATNYAAAWMRHNTKIMCWQCCLSNTLATNMRENLLRQSSFLKAQVLTIWSRSKVNPTSATTLENSRIQDIPHLSVYSALAISLLTKSRKQIFAIIKQQSEY